MYCLKRVYAVKPFSIVLDLWSYENNMGIELKFSVKRGFTAVFNFLQMRINEIHSIEAWNEEIIKLKSLKEKTNNAALF